MFRIDNKAQRMKLPERRDPYFVKLDKGCSLGFRRGPDTWVARYKDRAGKYQFKALGAFEEFGDAKRAAEDWIAQMSGGARRTARRGTVRDALLAYVGHLRDSGRPDTADDVMAKLRASILGNLEPKKRKPRPPHRICDQMLEECTKEDFMSWRKDLQKTGRANKTINRYMTCIAAALNCATKECGHVGNAAAWTLSDLDEGDAEGDSAVYLTPEQRKHLTASLEEWFRPFVQLIDATGGRPQEIAKATVVDYDSRAHAVTLRWKKGRPAKWKARNVTLSSKDRALLKAVTKDKLPGAPLVAREDGGFLTHHVWAREINRGIRLANMTAMKQEQIVPRNACAYSYRHTRISELLQYLNVDALTVCKQTGTSLAMLEKYYWKFLPNAMREKLETEAAEL